MPPEMPARKGGMEPAAPREISTETGGVTKDSFWEGRLQVCQPKNGPRSAIDALLLAKAVSPQSGQTVFEAGSGNGIVSLSIGLDNPSVSVTGLEIQQELYDLSVRNRQDNGLPNVRFLLGDLTRPLSSLKSLGIGAGQFDHVIANPPYYLEHESRVSGNEMIRKAYSADRETLDRWMRFLAGIARARGQMTLIHRADMVQTLLGMMEGRFGAVKIFPVHPRSDLAATRVLLQGIKGSRAPVSLHRGLVLHNGTGGYTPEASRVIHNGHPLW